MGVNGTEFQLGYMWFRGLHFLLVSDLHGHSFNKVWWLGFDHL